MKIKRILSAFLAGAVVLGSMAIPAFADETETITLTEFVKKVTEGNGTYDGNGITVKVSPKSGCRDTRDLSKTKHSQMSIHEGETALKAGEFFAETPKNVNSELAQFFLYDGEKVAINVSNVNFVYEPADFTFCANGWNGSYTKEEIKTGQLYFVNEGNVTFDKCTFDNIVLTVRDDQDLAATTTGKSVKITGCTFKNIFDSYGLKDINASDATIIGNEFTNCGGGIMLCQHKSSTVGKNVVISDNKFTNVDVEDWAKSGKAGTRGLIQFASTCTFTDDSKVSVKDNTATTSGPVFRMLTETIKSIDYTGNKFEGSALATDDKGIESVTKLIEKSSTNVAQVGDTEYATLADAIAAAAQQTDNGENAVTVTLLRDATGGGVKTGERDEKGNEANVDVNKKYNVVIDFNDHTYTINGGAVGSKNTETNAFQLLKGSKVTMKNGSIVIDNKDIKIAIQNYCDLTLENMTVNDVSSSKAEKTFYILSANYGNTILSNVNFSANFANTVAIDLMHWENDSYVDKAPTISISNTSDNTIKGNIEVYCYRNTGTNTNPEWKVLGETDCLPTLTVTGGKFSDKSVADYLADGYTVKETTDGLYEVVKEERTENFGDVAVLTGEKTENDNPLLTLFSGINYLDYKNAGFDVEIGGEKQSVTTTVVYTRVDVNGTKYEKESFGSEYIFGAKLELDKTKYGDIGEFTITPFATTLDGNKLTGKTVTVGISNSGQSNPDTGEGADEP